MKITIFGGAQPKEDSTAYAEARELGSLLATTWTHSCDRRLHGHNGSSFHAGQMNQVGM
ncbi:MAG: hypothetical protein HC797_05050 [Anaerolineales bacterium]|nr:hypothetical protein [Anaerolineales bacterium]